MDFKTIDRNKGCETGWSKSLKGPNNPKKKKKIVIIKGAIFIFLFIF
jgi:hypothetical protein